MANENSQAPNIHQATDGGGLRQLWVKRLKSFALVVLSMFVAVFVVSLIRGIDHTARGSIIVGKSDSVRSELERKWARPDTAALTIRLYLDLSLSVPRNEIERQLMPILTGLHVTGAKSANRDLVLLYGFGSSIVDLGRVDPQEKWADLVLSKVFQSIEDNRSKKKIALRTDHEALFEHLVEQMSVPVPADSARNFLTVICSDFLYDIGEKGIETRTKAIEHKIDSLFSGCMNQFTYHRNILTSKIQFSPLLLIELNSKGFQTNSISLKQLLKQKAREYEPLVNYFRGNAINYQDIFVNYRLPYQIRLTQKWDPTDLPVVGRNTCVAFLFDAESRYPGTVGVRLRFVGITDKVEEEIINIRNGRQVYRSREYRFSNERHLRGESLNPSKAQIHFDEGEMLVRIGSGQADAEGMPYRLLGESQDPVYFEMDQHEIQISPIDRSEMTLIFYNLTNEQIKVKPFFDNCTFGITCYPDTITILPSDNSEPVRVKLELLPDERLYRERSLTSFNVPANLVLRSLNGSFTPLHRGTEGRFEASSHLTFKVEGQLEMVWSSFACLVSNYLVDPDGYWQSGGRFADRVMFLLRSLGPLVLFVLCFWFMEKIGVIVIQGDQLKNTYFILCLVALIGLVVFSSAILKGYAPWKLLFSRIYLASFITAGIRWLYIILRENGYLDKLGANRDALSVYGFVLNVLSFVIALLTVA